MRLMTILLAGAAFTGATSASAADALKFGPPPSWVVPQPIPTDAKKTDAPVSLLLSDEQIAFDPGKTTIYHDGALKIQNSQGLTAAGNIAVAWDPATDTVTINKFHIIRGSKVIDVLASGQTFTTLRRETNLDAATLDGTLTATMQPEDLQEGDIIELATTIERVDPVLKDHDQATFASWGETHIDSAHALISWPQSMKVAFKEWPGTPEAHKSVKNGRDIVELSANNLDPVVPPSGAPLRFKVARLAQATNYASWDEVSQLMLPLFQKAAVVPPAGPLHDEVEKIRAASKDPKTRAEQALALVEARVRYVALEMGQGGYVPASAETTWSRRFGDCKAKSALLLAILQSLGIQAEPVLVNARGGDLVADDLPMLDFNHAIVRAHIAGKSYWLDGTRTSDTDLDGIQVPDFGWVLPLTVNASLVHLVPSPLDKPLQERHVEIDATSGLFAPAAVSIVETYRGDGAVASNIVYSSLSSEQREQALHDEAKGFFDTFVVSSSDVRFDRAKRELTLTIKGSARLSWKDGWSEVPASSIGYDPDFDRPPSPLHDVPLAVNYPNYVKDAATIRLPVGVAAKEKLSNAIHETLAGVEYERSEAVNSDVLSVESSERSVAPEVAYKDAVAAEDRLRALSKDRVYLEVPTTYRSTSGDLTALATNTPVSAQEYAARADALLSLGKLDDALKDTDQVIALGDIDPELRLMRANIFMKKGDFEAVAREADLLVQENPQSDFALVAAAKSYAALGKPKKAMELFDRALTIKPQAYIYVNRAQVRPASDVSGQLADLTQALKLEPNMPEAVSLEASLLSKQGKYADALALYDRIPQSAATEQWIGVQRAILLHKAGRTRDSEKAFAELESGAKTPNEFNSLCWTKATNDMFLDSALTDCQQALKLSPDTGQYLDSLGMVLLKLGRLDEALDAYTKAIAKGMGADSLMGRAFVYLKKGDRAHAEADAAAARKIYPDIEDTFAEYGLKFDQAPAAVKVAATTAGK